MVKKDLFTAVLGGEIIVPTLTGKVKLRIPPGTQSGQKFRLKGHAFLRSGPCAVPSVNTRKPG